MNLAQALRDAVRRGPDEEPRPGRARSIEEVIDVFGGVSALAARLTDTEGVPYSKRGREFRASVRRLQRYRQGIRHPSAQFLRELRPMATREQGKRRRLDRRAQLTTYGSPVRVKGTVTISSDTSTREVGKSSPMWLEGGEWREIIEALDAGDPEAAEDAFQDALSARHFYGAAVSWANVDYVATQ